MSISIKKSRIRSKDEGNFEFNDEENTQSGWFGMVAIALTTSSYEFNFPVGHS